MKLPPNHPIGAATRASPIMGRNDGTPEGQSNLRGRSMAA